MDTFFISLDVFLGGAGGSSRVVAPGGGTGLFASFSDAFSECFNIITNNPVLLIILGAAIGIPLLGAVISIFRGR